MRGMSDRDRLLLQVQQLGFMTDDLRLFLNTHPDCDDALCALKYYIAAERDAVKEYEKKYGPLTLEGVEQHDCYSWINRPWPWEMEG